ncbi:glycosyltransferase family 2 protein [Spirosoma sp. 209]|uniref:glycosyltransferase family 2 protein n=1 Tax=Spirosoma sp. 209 TaxID=1955701 RepID=UPI00098D3C30|nr:glycosyltransferase family 2 protein [Spirosoma sp. 209]
MDSLALVILNYNGQSFLAKFLPAVLAHADGHPVYVADSASTDGSIALLRAHFPTVRVIELARNEGYAGGYNRALDYIRTNEAPFDYYALINSDIDVTPGWLSPILSVMASSPTVAACQPKIRSYQQRDLFEHAGAAGGFVDWLGYVFCRGRVFATFEADQGQYDDNRPVFWATGACLFVRAKVFHQTGGFDASFFAHMEEIDWCWRVQRLGYEVWTCGQSVVYHVGGGTLPKSNPHKTYLNYRNSLFMLYKNWPADGRLWLRIFLRLVLDGLSSLLFVKVGQWRDVWAIIRAHFAFYAHLPQLNQQRRALRQQQTHAVSLFPRSIVWSYFGQGKKTYRDIVDNRK